MDYCCHENRDAYMKKLIISYPYTYPYENGKQKNNRIHRRNELTPKS